ncbi:hypothetical protein BD410DRAFT_493013 [Rickenella mellea]|uniref:Uncharacterized protein n=1 Tax=Rickenella mellea TaxID=50990 RepID=A0A4Y7PU33_9AGAM|nr:hypothetical protein BD410DRAFT_493013 [Rickenella mellea]
MIWIGSPRFPLTHMSRISAQTNSRDSGNVQTYAHVYSRFQAGAVKMESFDLRHPLFYSDYCFRHCESWLQAAHAADEDIEIKDLTFVTGINMVNAWALFALPSSSGGCSIQFTTGPTTMLAIREDSQSSNPLDCPPIMNFGPVGRKEPGSLDQCVTIRRFKMHRRMQKLRWKVGQGLRKVIVKRTEVADALTKPESAKEEDIEEDSETSNDNKKGRIRRRKAKPSPGCSIEATDLPNDRRGGGGGGASSGGKDGDPNRGLPPGNGGGRRDTGSGSSGSDSGNGTLGQVTRYTLNAVVTSDSEDESVDYKPMEPLDALLEYILERLIPRAIENNETRGPPSTKRSCFPQRQCLLHVSCIPRFERCNARI